MFSTTFDRFLLRQYFLVFTILFVVVLGLFAIVDGFTNLDGFQKATRHEGQGALLWTMGKRYFYQSSMLFDMATPFLAVLSMVVVLTLLLKHGELHPILAAGVPTYRVCLPFLAGIAVVNALAAANQEWILPEVAPFLHAAHSDGKHDSLAVQPQFDRYGTYIAGGGLYLAEGRIMEAEFRLPFPELAREYVSIRAASATYLPPQGELAGGWLLDHPQPEFHELPLTDQGRQVVAAVESTGQIFVRSDVTSDQLAPSIAGHRYISTAELIRRVRFPTGTMNSARAQLLNFHWRLTRFLVNAVGFFLVVPFLVRKEHDGLLGNIAACTLALSIVYAWVVSGYYLGQIGLVSVETAIWLPLISSGAYCAWISGWVRT